MKKAFALLLLFGMSNAMAQTNSLRFISYNILQGMRLDTAKGKPLFVNWVKEQHPDVLALEEVTGFTQASLEELAKSYGHPYAELLVEGEKYPVAITSKYPISNVKKVISNMDRGFITAEISGYQVLVVHLTPFDYRKRREEIDLMLAEVQSNSNRKNWVLMGDFNTVSPLDSAAYKDGKLAESYKRYEKTYAPILKLSDGKIDYTVIQKVLNVGFVDAIKAKNPSFIKTVHPKAFEPKSGPDVPSRIDFIFVSRDLRQKILSAGVIMDPFTDKYSDHYPVVADVKF